jgi:hypothetical protein
MIILAKVDRNILGDIVSFIESLISVTVVVVQVSFVPKFDKLEFDSTAFNASFLGAALEGIKDSVKLNGGEGKVLRAKVETPGHARSGWHELGK